MKKKIERLEPENKLQDCIDGKGWSVSKTAKEAGLSDQTVRRMLNREKTSRTSKVKVAMPFSITAKEIFPNCVEL